jgi:hypothetical protein
MPCQLQIEHAGAIWHVLRRAIAMAILLDDVDRQDFRETDFGPNAPENPTTPGIKHDIIINRYLSHGRRHWRTAANAVRNQAQRK